MNNNLKEIGLRLRQVRKENRLSQSELAELMNVSPPYISDMENGKINFSVESLKKVVEALQISADWLLQIDTPSVNAIQDNEIISLLSDCSPKQKQSFIRLINDMKKTMNNDDY